MKKNCHRLLGPYLKKHRLGLGLSRKKVAIKLGCTEQFILNFEHGVCSPPGPMLKILIDVYKLDPNEVLEILLQESLAEWTAAVSSKTINQWCKKINIKSS